MDLLLDTHVWIWFALGDPKLPSTIRARIERPDTTCWLSPVSVWELGMLAQKGRIETPLLDLQSWVRSCWQRLSLREAPLSREVALKSLELDLPHRDPADRFIAATALVYELTLATADHRLLAAPWLATV